MNGSNENGWNLFLPIEMWIPVFCRVVVSIVSWCIIKLALHGRSVSLMNPLHVILVLWASDAFVGWDTSNLPIDLPIDTPNLPIEMWIPVFCRVVVTTVSWCIIKLVLHGRSVSLTNPLHVILVFWSNSLCLLNVPIFFQSELPIRIDSQPFWIFLFRGKKSVILYEDLFISISNLLSDLELPVSRFTFIDHIC
jgi:hypothetical protein